MPPEINLFMGYMGSRRFRIFYDLRMMDDLLFEILLTLSPHIDLLNLALICSLRAFEEELGTRLTRGRIVTVFFHHSEMKQEPSRYTSNTLAASNKLKQFDPSP